MSKRSLDYLKIQGFFVLFVLLIDFVWVLLCSNTFVYHRTDMVVFFCALGLFWILYYFYRKTHPIPKIVVVWLSLLLFVTYNTVAIVLLYSAYTVDWPLVTDKLACIDCSLGFDFLKLYQWFDTHQIWNAIFTHIYKMHFIEIGFILIFFGFFRAERFIQQFLMLYMISYLLTIIFGSLFPAEGTYVWYNYVPQDYQLKALNHLYELRRGVIDVTHIDGIVEFPSFHTTLALLFIYTFRNEKKIIFIPVFILNILMIFSCLAQGAHFLTDIFGGIVVFMMTLGIEFLLLRRLNLSSHCS